MQSHEFLSHLHRVDVPDLLGVLVDGPVAAELAGPQRVQDRFFGPLGLVCVCLVHLSERENTLSWA